ncbi:hypothetical protein T09_12923 [Trichinella sp. T9]|nr:hypothetical protein T09_12923 [Trichinella sp. T9]
MYHVYHYPAVKNTVFKEKKTKERMNWQCMFCTIFRSDIPAQDLLYICISKFQAHEDFIYQSNYISMLMITCAHMLPSIEFILNPKCLNFKYLSLEDPEVDRMQAAGHGLDSLAIYHNDIILQCSCLSIESHWKDKFHFVIWKQIIIILSIYRKLFLSTNNRNILRHSVLHSNVACKLRIEGSQDDRVHVFETGYYVYGIHSLTRLRRIRRSKRKGAKKEGIGNASPTICFLIYLFCFGEENDNLTLSVNFINEEE